MTDNGIGTSGDQPMLGSFAVLYQVGETGTAPEHAQLAQYITADCHCNAHVHDPIMMPFEKVVFDG